MNTNSVQIGRVVSCGHCNKNITYFFENYGLKCECICHMNTNKEEWVEMFDTEYAYIAQSLDFYASEHYIKINKKGTEHLEDIKNFIREERAKVLDDYRKQLKEGVGGIKKEQPGTHICFPLTEITITNDEGKEICVHKHEVDTFNKALQQVLELINNN